MKTKFSNDDRRFKIDDRFVEDDAENGDKQGEEEDDNENDEEEEAFEDEDEDENAKPKKSNKKQLKKEKLNALRILEEITEKPMLKPIDVDIDDKERSRRLLQKTKPIVRYNPTRRDHKKFEITEERKEQEDNEKGSSSTDESQVEEKSKKKKKNKKDDEKNEEEASVPREIPEDKSKFFKIEPNLKDLFSSNDVFKFKFNNDDEEEEIEDEDEDEEANLNQRPKSGLKTSMLFGSNLKKSKYSSSSSEGEDYEEEEEEEEEMDAEFEKKKPVLAKKTAILDEKINELKSFLPDFDNDKEVNDALKYFGGKESTDLDDFRKDWTANREKLVEVS